MPLSSIQAVQIALFPGYVERLEKTVNIDKFGWLENDARAVRHARNNLYAGVAITATAVATKFFLSQEDSAMEARLCMSFVALSGCLTALAARRLHALTEVLQLNVNTAFDFVNANSLFSRFYNA